MGALETQVKPYLIPLIKGQPTVIDDTAKKILVTWITLKTLIADHNYLPNHPPDPIFDQATRDEFRLSRQMPAGIRIWLGSHNGSKWTAAFHRSSTGVGFTTTLPPPPQPTGRFPNTKAITWGMGHLLIYVNVAIDPQVYTILEVNHRGTLAEIWPLTKTNFGFPRRFWFTDRQIDDLAVAFDTFIRRNVVTWVPG